MDHFIDQLVEISLNAGKKVTEIYESDFKSSEKEDGSALTEADERAEAYILAKLGDYFPTIPVLAEEAASKGEIPELGNEFFLVDPLDGTREFVNKTGEFTVNIAKIVNGAPVAGVVLAPALNKVWYGEVGKGAWTQDIMSAEAQLVGTPSPIVTRPKPAEGLIAVASRSHRSAETEDLLTQLGATDFKPAGSSLKFCLVAEGQADVYPRLGRTMEWDTGAGQAVLEAAGGRVHTLSGTEEGAPLRYGKKSRGYDNPHFIAWGA